MPRLSDFIDAWFGEPDIVPEARLRHDVPESRLRHDGPEARLRHEPARPGAPVPPQNRGIDPQDMPPDMGIINRGFNEGLALAMVTREFEKAMSDKLRRMFPDSKEMPPEIPEIDIKEQEYYDGVPLPPVMEDIPFQPKRDV